MPPPPVSSANLERTHQMTAPRISDPSASPAPRGGEHNFFSSSSSFVNIPPNTLRRSVSFSNQPPTVGSTMSQSQNEGGSGGINNYNNNSALRNTAADEEGSAEEYLRQQQQISGGGGLVVMRSCPPPSLRSRFGVAVATTDDGSATGGGSALQSFDFTAYLCGRDVAAIQHSLRLRPDELNEDVGRAFSAALLPLLRAAVVVPPTVASTAPFLSSSSYYSSPTASPASNSSNNNNNSCSYNYNPPCRVRAAITEAANGFMTIEGTVDLSLSSSSSASAAAHRSLKRDAVTCVGAFLMDADAVVRCVEKGFSGAYDGAAEEGGLVASPTTRAFSPSSTVSTWGTQQQQQQQQSPSAAGGVGMKARHPTRFTSLALSKSYVNDVIVFPEQIAATLAKRRQQQQLLEHQQQPFGAEGANTGGSYAYANGGGYYAPTRLVAPTRDDIVYSKNTNTFF